jgi:hypothetical protein
LTITDQSHTGTKILFRAEGGTKGVTYRISAIVTTTQGNVREGNGLLDVVEIAEAPEVSTTTIVTLDDVMTELGWSDPTAGDQKLIESALLRAVGSIKQYLQYDPIYGAHIDFYPLQSFMRTASGGVWEASDTHAYFRRVSEAATSEMQLKHMPVRTITEVRIDYDGRNASRTGSFSPTSIKTEGQDFWPNSETYDIDGLKVCMDGIIRTIGLWPVEPGTVKVSYYAGYKDAEFRGAGGALDASPIFEAALYEVCRRVRRAAAMKKGALGLPVGLKTNESLGSYSYTMDARASDRLFSGALSPEAIALLQPFVNWGAQLG